MTDVRRIKPQPGPQEQFSACPADICIYGGSAFGGKTWALAFEAARYVTVAGYAAVIFRRESPQLTGGGSIWEETQGMYPHLSGVPRGQPNLDWRFPSGSLIEFRHLQLESDMFAHQGKQYTFIGFDELTHFTAAQFWYLLSRLRSAVDVPKRIRATCNPDPSSFVRELIDWWIGPDGQALPERSGVIRWMVRLDERLIWGATPDEVWEQAPERIRRRGEAPRDDGDMRPSPMSFTFIRAAAKDNKIGLSQNPEYLSQLALLPGAQSKRLLLGDWNAKDSAGDYFNRTTFPIVDEAPSRIIASVRFWDKAATSPSSANPDPDWTVGALVHQLEDGRYYVEDVQELRAGPSEVIARIKHTAQMDGRTVYVGLWQDPGQAGLVDIEATSAQLVGFGVKPVRAAKDKQTYAAAWSPHAAKGKVLVKRSPYLPTLFGYLEAFPDPKVHDDHVDAISGAFQVLTGGAWEVGYDSPRTMGLESSRRDAWGDDMPASDLNSQFTF